MTPRVSIVVVTHKHRAFIERCLESLDRARAEIAIEVLVVDNRSNDGTVEIVKARFPWARVDVRDRRRGFSDNNNFGIARTTAPYVLILNPDTEVRPGALTALATFMDRTPAAGIAGAKLLFPDGSVQPSYRRFPNLSSVLVRRTPLRWFMRDSAANARHLMLDHSSTEPTEVDWLLGACLFVRRAAIEDVGPMDEGYFLYVEDIDWCRRMRNRGWKVFWVPQAEIVHHHLAVSDRKFFTWYSWVHVKSMIRYYRKHMAPAWLRKLGVC
jgi:N-acetylglucosaminyl-diphospho-decaprenol L-rhamnosyltransferase